MKRSLTNIFVAAIFVAACSTVLLGCDSEDKTTYDVTVYWEIGGIQSCTSSALGDEFGGVPLQFDEVKITVYENEGDEEAVQDTTTVSCDDKEFTIYSLERGEFFIVLEAMADHQGQYLPYFKGTATVVAPAEGDESYPISMRLNTGSAEVGWGFDKGVCSSTGNMVKDVMITLTGINNTVETEKIPCENAQYLFEELKWDLYTLEVVGLNESSEMTHQGIWIDESGDTDEADAGADDTNEDRLDIRPGSFIGADEAYVKLEPISS